MTRPWGVPVAIVVGLVVALACFGLCRRWPAPRLLGLLPLCSLAGIYACVPETTHLHGLAVVFGLLAVVGLAGIDLGATTYALAAGVLVWAAWFGGQSRASGLVGGLAALGLFVVEPLAARLPVRRIAGGPVGAVALLALQFTFAVSIARNAGLRHDLAPSVGIVAAWSVALVASASLFVPQAER